METQRPNPDELLAQVQAEQRQAVRGRLKVFFGACAGVGKTFTMLQTARAPLGAGLDVVVGYVEPHARPETMALLHGLETLPVRRVDYRGATLTEFDLDGALRRKPKLLLVDELAHTNAPGSRHAKRWQDVTELLEAGIDVYTTLNVQHIETLNDVVAQFSSVRVRETVPDTIFDQADEVELVDLPPDDLLQRLAEGKVYVPDRAAAALRSFFQKANLVALRELALRRMAERVNVQAESYRHEGEVVPTTDRLLVCVGPSPFSSRLVRAAARMAMTQRCPWLAVSVELAGSRVSQEAQDRVWANLRMAGLLGAETATLSGVDVAREIVAYAQARHVTVIVVGKSLRGRWGDLLRSSLVHGLIRQAGSIDVHVVSGDPGPSPPRRADGRPRRPRPEWPWRNYVLSVLIVAACTGVGKLLATFYLSTTVLVYLLGVMLIALQGRRGPAVLAALLSASALNLFFLEPLHTFVLVNPVYWATASALAVAGVVVSTLAVRVRRQADAARQRELRTLALYAMSRELATASTVSQVTELARRHVGKALTGDVLMLLADPTGRLDGSERNAGVNRGAGVSPARPAGILPASGVDGDFASSSGLANGTHNAGETPASPAAPAAARLGAQDLAVAQWVLEHNQPAGLGTDTLPACPFLFAPLGSSIGVIGVRPLDRRPLWPDQLQLLTTMAALVSGALERIRMTRFP